MADGIEEAGRVENGVGAVLRDKRAHLIGPVAVGSANGFEAHLTRQGEALRISSKAGDNNRRETEGARRERGTQADWAGALDYSAVTGGERRFLDRMEAGREWLEHRGLLHVHSLRHKP